ncbi:MAG: polysaccharide deacetylase family protein [Clostridia bacterium]|nr:polysaccharide deacetylase family protein [Clostridia bacterium]
MKRLLSILLLISLLLSLAPAALADAASVSFASDRLSYNSGESTELIVRAKQAPESDLAIRITDNKKNAYEVVIPAGQTEASLTVSSPLSGSGSTTTFTIERSENYSRKSPYQCSVSAKGACMYSFGAQLYQQFTDRDLKFSVKVANPTRLEKGTVITIRDDTNGTVMETFEHNPNKTQYSFTYRVDESWMPGRNISVWVDGREQADSTTILAVGISGAKTIRGVRRDDNKISFTMDAGSSGKNVPTILDILDKHGVKITFFVTGKFANSYPEYVKMMAERGHEIGNHSWSHPSFTTLSVDKILSEVNRTRDLVYELTGKTTVLFRPPKGDCNSKVRSILNAAGYEVIRWTHESYDSRDGATKEKSLKFSTKDITGGSIILTHVNADWTVAVLDEILTWYEENGFEVVPVSELLYYGNTATDDDGLQYLVD